MNNVVIYARVSTDSQDTGNQLDALKGWIASRGWTLVDTYQEAETAWKAGHQAALSELLKAARKRRFDTVIVWALDRLSRQGPLAVLSLINNFSQYQVKVISYQESWTELPGPAYELLLSITAWVAQFESARRSERTKAGLARRKSQGKRLGRPAGSKDAKKRVRRWRKHETQIT
jgi:putative DNA-invertase from lambdoid prophage Rac